ncbi:MULTISPECIES: GUN4 domain-containing protein [unclassified Microcoleus]|jgi:eukaryotic-like serine/threonine-protein kinase|uniref:GUN4 domain-containing protein n=1 Tax=unclassified Microcoleus TaxID=2642155 RepID=UPI0025D5A01D|nr:MULTISPECIES: GUN4 domain-containing protein [unclassified Microcoleus]
MSQAEKNEVELVSAVGIDYSKLRDLVAANKWEEADRETLRVMLKVAGTKQEWLDTESIEKFPCEDLRTIDQLWVKYSKGHFGFSVQKLIYQSLGGTSGYNSEVWGRFGDRVGWRQKNQWVYYEDITFSEKAPEAQLPVLDCWNIWGICWWFDGERGREWVSILSRRDL